MKGPHFRHCWTAVWFILIVIPAIGQEYTYLPDNISPDETHAPFIHGVASGDPLTDRVILWTRISPETETADTVISVEWVISEDEAFTQIVGQGTVWTDSSDDFTIKVDAGNLQPNSTYYYRFSDTDENHSVTGRTRTLPTGQLDHIRFGVVSCSNVYYGYFNAYRRLAQNEDIHAVIHLGDFIYDNDGSNSPIRVPVPEPYSLNENDSGAEWADRHYYYHFDEDLRAMLAAHPLIAVWDNHDIDKNNHLPAAKAWLRWVPVREDSDDYRKIYRKLSFGNLADLYMTDVRLFSELDTLPGGEYSFLGDAQYEWLTGEMVSSGARWQLIGSQKNFATWNLGFVADLLDLDSPFFTTSNWDGRPKSRNRLKSFFSENEIDNIVFLTGDAHMGVLADIDPDPFDNEFDYSGNTGEGSLGVEFLPSGVTGRNLDDRGVPLGLANLVESISMSVNPHQFYLNMVQNGYGIIHLNRDSMSAWICYNNIVIETDEEWCHGPFVVYQGTNHWKRLNQSYEIPTATAEFQQAPIYLSTLFPNPASDKTACTITVRQPTAVDIKLHASDGRRISGSVPAALNLHTGTQKIHLDVAELAAGPYVLSITSAEGTVSRTFVVAR